MAPDEQAAINLSLSLTAIFYILLSLLVCVIHVAFKVQVIETYE